MGLRLPRRRHTEPVRPAAAPPADGCAPCLDAYSRRWAPEPVAGRFVDWEAAAHHAGFGHGFAGVWHADEPLTPLERFGIDPAGILTANLFLRLLEIVPRLAGRRLPGARLTAEADGAVLLLAEERETPGWHVHAGVHGTAWFVHAFRAGPLEEIPLTEPGSATLSDALERALDTWGPVDWQAVPSGTPRGLLDSVGWVPPDTAAEAS